MSRYPVHRRARAELELFAHVDRIAEENLDAALRFVDAVEEALSLISEHPELGAPYETGPPRLQALRKRVIPRST